MTHELARRLKEAGFPQVYKYGKLYYNSQKGFIPASFALQNERMVDGDLRFPDLNELVEACGARFWNLAQLSDNKTWVVHSVYPDHRETGFTPEEALAKLWIALNV